MLKDTKRIALVLAGAGMMAAALSGCMPTGTASGGGSESQNGLMGFLPIILIIAVMYFVMIRPQQKKTKQVNDMRNALKAGDWVTTIGGFRGRVLRINDDVVTIAVGADKTKLDIMRWGISKIDEAAPARAAAYGAHSDAEVDALVDAAAEEPAKKPKKLTKAAKPADEDGGAAAVIAPAEEAKAEPVAEAKAEPVKEAKAASVKEAKAASAKGAKAEPAKKPATRKSAPKKADAAKGANEE